MTTIVNILLAQLDFCIGDISYNTKKIITTIEKAKLQKTDLLIFPELALCGYPPEDLLLRPSFIRQVEQALLEIVTHTQGITVILGLPHQTPQGLYNAAVLLKNQKIEHYYYKQYLPNYGVFDEARYFVKGHENFTFKIKETTFALLICE